jgi:predicted DNA-binding transcriptional regulator AlpA
MSQVPKKAATRRPRKAPTAAPFKLSPRDSFAYINFDSLPATGRVRLPVVVAMTMSSAPTVWRRVKEGLLPRPMKDGVSGASWNVGELRAAIGAKG